MSRHVRWREAGAGKEEMEMYSLLGDDCWQSCVPST